MFSVLLIDDDSSEELIVSRLLAELTTDSFKLAYVDQCSKGMRLLNEHQFDLILLDDRLSQTINATFTVRMLKNTTYLAPIVISTNDSRAPYLQDPKLLGVADVVDKARLGEFLKDWLSSLPPEKRSA